MVRCRSLAASKGTGVRESLTYFLGSSVETILPTVRIRSQRPVRLGLLWCLAGPFGRRLPSTMRAAESRIGERNFTPTRSHQFTGSARTTG